MKRCHAILPAALMLLSVLTACGSAPTPAADTASDSGSVVAATAAPEPTVPVFPAEDDSGGASVFECNADGEIVACTGAEQDVTIPASVGGGEVVGIGCGAFRDNGDIASVTISEGVTYIQSQAFCGCGNLRTVALPGSLTSIGSRAFQGCASLERITVGGRLIEIGSGAFEGCENLKEIDLSGLEAMGEDAFSGSGIVDIVIPGTLKVIPAGAFEGCRNVESITIGEGVEVIEEYAFCTCGQSGKTTDTYNFLTDEEVQEHRDAVHANDPACQRFFEITLPSTVREVQENAFLGTRLDGLYLPWLSSLDQLPETFMPCFEHYECVYVSPEALDSIGADRLDRYFAQDDCFEYWAGSVRVFDGRHHYWTDEELGLDP